MARLSRAHADCPAKSNSGEFGVGASVHQEVHVPASGLLESNMAPHAPTPHLTTCEVSHIDTREGTGGAELWKCPCQHTYQEGKMSRAAGHPDALPLKLIVIPLGSFPF